MSILLRPKFQALDNNGDPLSGGKIYFYEAGSTTPKDTYSDSSLTTPNANPVVLDARGEFEIYGSGTYRVITKTSADVQIDNIDNVIGISDNTVSVTEWTSPGHTPTYVSATSFTVSGDQTNTYQAGRRFKAIVTAGTVYGTIVSSAYTTLTTVTVVVDSGSLDSGLSQVDVGLLTATNHSVPYGAPEYTVTITPSSDANVTLSSSENAASVRVLVDGSWTSGHSLICDDADRKFTLVNNSSYTATITTSGTTPTTVDVPSGTIAVVFVRAGVGAEFAGYPVLDEDSFASNSATAVPTQQSVKAYVDGKHGLLHIQDQKTSGTDGGASSVGSNTRTINTVLTNEITGASLSSNQITLPAGTYYIDASAPAHNVGRHMLRIYDTTAAAFITDVDGTSAYTTTAGTYATTTSRCYGRFTLSTASVLELRHQIETAKLTNGLGVESGSALTVDHETYTDVRIWMAE